MDVLELADIIDRNDRHKPIEPFPTPEWPEADGKLFIRTCSASEIAAFEDDCFERDEKGNRLGQANLRTMRQQLFALCLCNADGKRIFSDDQMHKVNNFNACVVDRGFWIAHRLNAIGSNSVKELAKNSVNGQHATALTA